METSANQFIGMLRARLNDAQSRLAEKQAKLQVAQTEHQMAMQEVGSLQTLINLETTREQQRIAAEQRSSPQGASRPNLPPPARNLPVAPAPQEPAGTQSIAVSGDQPQHTNKTTVVRDVLRKHTNGITPADVWRLAQNKVDRPYVYSILKRMKDRGEVEERAGKYYLQVRKQERGGAPQVQ